MEGNKVNTIGLTVGKGAAAFCVIVYVGQTPVFIHGTPDEVKAFGREIIEAAEADRGRYEETVAAMKKAEVDNSLEYNFD